jgi:hypothetical protein
LAVLAMPGPSSATQTSRCLSTAAHVTSTPPPVSSAASAAHSSDPGRNVDWGELRRGQSRQTRVRRHEAHERLRAPLDHPWVPALRATRVDPAVSLRSE